MHVYTHIYIYIHIFICVRSHARAYTPTYTYYTFMMSVSYQTYGQSQDVVVLLPAAIAPPSPREGSLSPSHAAARQHSAKAWSTAQLAS